MTVSDREPSNQETEEVSEEMTDDIPRATHITDDTLIDELLPKAGVSGDYVAPFGFEHSPEMLETRLENTKEMDVPVYPTQSGVYVFPDGEYQVDLDTHDERFGDRATCDCGDFYYRASNQGFDCKHILYVKRLVANGYLPPISEPDIRGWMNARTILFVDYLEEQEEQTVSELLAEEVAEVKQEIKQELKTPLETDLVEVERKAEAATSFDPTSE